MVAAGKKAYKTRMANLRRRKRKGSHKGKVVGFYKDHGKTKPITKSVAQLNRQKVVKGGKQFKGVKPREIKWAAVWRTHWGTDQGFTFASSKKATAAYIAALNKRGITIDVTTHGFEGRDVFVPKNKQAEAKRVWVSSKAPNLLKPKKWLEKEQSTKTEGRSIGRKATVTKIWSGDWGAQYRLKVGNVAEQVDVYKPKKGKILVTFVRRGRQTTMLPAKPYESNGMVAVRDAHLKLASKGKLQKFDR